jgi:hypothetical protein
MNGLCNLAYISNWDKVLKFQKALEVIERISVPKDNLLVWTPI